MKPVNIFQLEIAGVFASGRSIFMKLGYAYLLGLPFALISMPSNVRVIGITMLILFTSFFGAATTIVSRRSDGQLGRLELLPISRATLISDLLLSGSLIDLLQVSVVIVMLLLVNGTSVTFPLISAIAGSFVLSVVFLNVLGMLLGAISKNSQEVHLIGAIGVGLIGFLSGLYPVPERIDPFVSAISRYNPLRLLAQTMTWSMTPGETPELSGLQVGLSAAVLLATILLFASRIKPRRPSNPVRRAAEGVSTTR